MLRAQRICVLFLSFALIVTRELYLCFVLLCVDFDCSLFTIHRVRNTCVLHLIKLETTIRLLCVYYNDDDISYLLLDICIFFLVLHISSHFSISFRVSRVLKFNITPNAKYVVVYCIFTLYLSLTENPTDTFKIQVPCLPSSVMMQLLKTLFAFTFFERGYHGMGTV